MEVFKTQLWNCGTDRNGECLNDKVCPESITCRGDVCSTVLGSEGGVSLPQMFGLLFWHFKGKTRCINVTEKPTNDSLISGKQQLVRTYVYFNSLDSLGCGSVLTVSRHRFVP